MTARVVAVGNDDEGFLALYANDKAESAINVVLVDTHIKYKKSLKSGDKFFVDTQLVRIGKLKFIFKQKIFLDGSNDLILESENITCCVNAGTGKICVPAELEKIKIEAKFKR